MNIWQFLKKNSFWFLLGSLILILLFSRAMPFIFHGPFGFGYDTGIYKHIFEGITSVSAVLKSEIYLLPAFLAYTVNYFGMPLDGILYYGYIFFGVAIAWPLYLLTKHYFGRNAGIVAVAILIISYVQFAASQIYLFKAELGAIFMLFAFYYYARRSWAFYIFAFLLALTQLPQLLILIVAVGVSLIVNFKKEFKYHAGLVIVAVCGLLFLWIFTPQHLVGGYNFLMDTFSGVKRVDSLMVGYLMTIGEFLKKEIVIILFSVAGLVLAFKKKVPKILPLYVGILFLAVVVFGKIFFERRYIMELDLLMIPFAAQAISSLFEKFRIKILGAVLLILIPFFVTIYYLITFTPSLTFDEVAALRFIERRDDISNVLVTSGMYAPWMYGFSGKETLAPGIFTSVWDYDQFVKYHSASSVMKASMLSDIVNKYGDFYLFLGENQRKEQQSLLETSSVRMVYKKGNAGVYKVSIPVL